MPRPVDFGFTSNGGGGMPIDTDTDINIKHRTGDRSKLGSMAEKEKRRTENHLFCFFFWLVGIAFFVCSYSCFT